MWSCGEPWSPSFWRITLHKRSNNSSSSNNSFKLFEFLNKFFSLSIFVSFYYRIFLNKYCLFTIKGNKKNIDNFSKNVFAFKLFLLSSFKQSPLPHLSSKLQTFFEYQTKIPQHKMSSLQNISLLAFCS